MSSCTIELEDVYGPAVAQQCEGGFDFTLLFEEIFFSIVPSVVLFALIPVRLFQLWHRPNYYRPSIFYYLKLVTHIGFVAALLAQLIILIGNVPKTRASIPAAAVALGLALATIILFHFDHVKSIRPSALLSLFFGLEVVFDIVRTRTLWNIEDNARNAIAFSVVLGFKTALFVLESLKKHKGAVHSSEDASSSSPETVGNVFVRSMFWWLNPLFWKGFRHNLDVDQLPPIDGDLLAPGRDRATWLRWKSLLNPSAGAMSKMLFAEYAYNVFQAVLPRLALSGFTFAQPFLITRVIQYAVSPKEPNDNNVGSGLIAATALIYIGLAISRANSQHKTYRIITRLRGACVALIYYKTLDISVPTAQHSSALTLMSTDVERSGVGMRLMHEVWASPVDIGLSIFLLQRQIGPSAAVPGVLYLLCSVASLRIAGSMASRQKLWLAAIERRVKTTSQMLSAIKEVRMGGLQMRVESELERLRQEEIRDSRKFKNALGSIVLLSYTTAALGPVFSFGIFSLLAKKNHTTPLTLEKGITSLSIFTLLRTPMSVLIDAVAGLVGSIGAFQRLGAYMAAPSHQPCTKPPQDPLPPLPRSHRDKGRKKKRHSGNEVPRPSGTEYKFVPLKPLASNASATRFSSVSDVTLTPSREEKVVVAEKYCAGWETDQEFVLTNLTFSISPGSLVLVVGPVGCGKSTLLHAILGETTANRGHLTSSFDRAAFCGQSPWLISDTIRSNIIGTNPLDVDWYQEVVAACDLQEDISRMPLGDQEMVSSGGSNFSGGQQARLAVARAVYSRLPVVFLDDVMSGLDAETEKRVFQNLFGPKGLLRGGNVTTIMATNALHRLESADQIIVLSAEGRLLEHGSFEELSSFGGRKIKNNGVGEEDSNAHATATTTIVDDEMQDIPLQDIDREINGILAKMQTPQNTDSARRNGDAKVYLYYAKSVGWFNMLLFVAFGCVFVFSLIFPQYVVMWWGRANQRKPNSHLAAFLGGYFGLSILALTSLALASSQLVLRMVPRASSYFHRTLLQTTLNAPLSLFAESSLGAVINRFSQDLELIDMELPLALFNTTVEFLSSIGNLIVIAVSAKYLAAALPAVVLVFYLIQVFYLRTARQLRLLDIEAKAPLVSHFLETLHGIVSIRSYGAQADYERRCLSKLNWSQKPNYLLYCAQRWLSLVLDLTVAGIAVLFITIAVKTRGKISPGLIGTALVGIVNFSASIKNFLSNWTKLETSIGAVSRVKGFADDTRSEHRPPEKDNPPPNWPSKGAVSISNVTATWDGKDSPAVKNLSLHIAPGQKVAICGRSGSGKSSIVSALLRLLEPSEGSISIDDVDLLTLVRQGIRGGIICVPQAPVVLVGTVRENVDPFDQAKDEDVIFALKRVKMLDTVFHKLGNLDAVIDNSKLSVGQRQLICMARATLRPGSVLVLDEATASLDLETDKIVQEVIRTAFKEHTIIAVAHRLQTIADFDRVLIISNGQVIEDDKPTTLLEDKTSEFAKLYAVSAAHDGDLIEEEKDVEDVGADTNWEAINNTRPHADSFDDDDDDEEYYAGYYEDEDDVHSPLANSSVAVLRRPFAAPVSRLIPNKQHSADGYGSPIGSKLARLPSLNDYALGRDIRLRFEDDMSHLGSLRRQRQHLIRVRQASVRQRQASTRLRRLDRIETDPDNVDDG